MMHVVLPGPHHWTSAPISWTVLIYVCFHLIYDLMAFPNYCPDFFFFKWHPSCWQLLSQNKTLWEILSRNSAYSFWTDTIRASLKWALPRHIPQTPCLLKMHKTQLQRALICPTAHTQTRRESLMIGFPKFIWVNNVCPISIKNSL